MHWFNQLILAIPGLPDSLTLPARVSEVGRRLKKLGFKTHYWGNYPRASILSLKLSLGTLFVAITDQLDETDLVLIRNSIEHLESVVGQRKLIAFAVHQILPKTTQRQWQKAYGINVYTDRKVGEIVSCIERLYD